MTLEPRLDTPRTLVLENKHITCHCPKLFLLSLYTRRHLCKTPGMQRHRYHLAFKRPPVRYITPLHIAVSHPESLCFFYSWTEQSFFFSQSANNSPVGAVLASSWFIFVPYNILIVYYKAKYLTVKIDVFYSSLQEMSYENRLGTNQECNLCGESCLVGKINYAEGNGLICLIPKLRW